MQQEKIPTIIIIGAGPGGLTLYHALVKNKDKKEFNVKIFERESGPKDRWQGYHISLNNHGIQSLMRCIPSSIILNLPKAMPNPIPGVEYHGFTTTDHAGNLLIKPPSKQVKDVYEIAKNPNCSAIIVAYRDRFREVLLEDVPVQWGKKCIGYEETEEGVLVYFEDGSRESCDILVGADGIYSPVRKQKIPELEVIDFGVTRVNANVAAPKHLIDRLIKIHGNGLIKESLGLKGDSAFIVLRLIPIEQEQNYKNNPNEQLHYRITIVYSYPTELDDEKFKVDDNNPESVIEHVKNMIRKLRPKCDLTDILLELWDLAPKTAPNDPKNYPFKTYNPVQRRKLQEINPLSVSAWTSSRVTLLGDAAHAMSPVLGLGTTNAIQDADVLSRALLNFSPENYLSCIKEYENEMIKRASTDVLNSRATTLKQILPIGYFGYITRNYSLKFTHIKMNVHNLFMNSVKYFRNTDQIFVHR